jgi:predicted Zn-ribbon and HTH transcriptional regulator
MARRPSLAGLLAKRHAEDEKLRAALEEMKVERDGLDARIREVEALLGRSLAAAARATRERPETARCADCGVVVPVPDNAGERGSECPACKASPFEYAGGGATH